jgi:hypothetical protein
VDTAESNMHHCNLVAQCIGGDLPRSFDNSEQVLPPPIFAPTGLRMIDVEIHICGGHKLYRKFHSSFIIGALKGTIGVSVSCG